MGTTSPFSSASVGRHYARGVVGLLALVAAFAGAALGVPALLLLLIVTVAAWRGCPTCWAIGLRDTRRRCDAEGCAGDAPTAGAVARAAGG